MGEAVRHRYPSEQENVVCGPEFVSIFTAAMLQMVLSWKTLSDWGSGGDGGGL